MSVMAKLALQEMGEFALPSYLPDPTPDQFRDEVRAAYARIADELRSVSPEVRAKLDVEIAEIEESGALGNASNREQKLTIAVFSVYVMALVQEFAHTVAYDPPMRAAVGDAVQSLGLDPDMLVTIASKIFKHTD